MIEICMAVHNTHHLIKLQQEYWEKTGKEVRIWVADDSTVPAPEFPDWIKIVRIPDIHAFDGVSYGAALDTIIPMTSSEYIVINDPDLFWLCPNIMEEFLKLGVDCFGTGHGGVPHTDNFIMPGRWGEDEKGWEPIQHISIPYMTGMVIRRSIALENSFILDLPTCKAFQYECGWRVRHAILAGGYSYRNLVGFRYFNQQDQENIFFGTPTRPFAIHIQSVTRRRITYENIKPKIEYYSAKWK